MSRFESYAVPSPPSPCDRLARLRVLWGDLTPSVSRGSSFAGWSPLPRLAGTPRASRVPDFTLPACRALKPRQSLRDLAFGGPCLIGFRLHVTVALRILTAIEAINRASEWCRHSCGPQDSLCTLHMSRSVGFRLSGYRPDRSALTSSTCATLGTGGWLSLPSMGLRSHTVPTGTYTPQVKPSFGPAHREFIVVELLFMGRITF